MEKNITKFSREHIFALRIDVNNRPDRDVRFELWLRDEKDMDVWNGANRVGFEFGRAFGF